MSIQTDKRHIVHADVQAVEEASDGPVYYIIPTPHLGSTETSDGAWGAKCHKEHNEHNRYPNQFLG